MGDLFDDVAAFDRLADEAAEEGYGELSGLLAGYADAIPEAFETGDFDTVEDTGVAAAYYCLSL